MNDKQPRPGEGPLPDQQPVGKARLAPGAKLVRKQPPPDKKPLADKQPLASKKRPPLPTVDDLVHQVLHLKGAVAMGAVSIQEANLILKTIKMVLDVLLKRSEGEKPRGDEAALSDACRRDPKLINLLLPFLTDEQVRNLMHEANSAPDDAVEDDE